MFKIFQIQICFLPLGNIVVQWFWLTAQKVVGSIPLPEAWQQATELQDKRWNKRKKEKKNTKVNTNIVRVELLKVCQLIDNMIIQLFSATSVTVGVSLPGENLHVLRKATGQK